MIIPKMSINHNPAVVWFEQGLDLVFDRFELDGKGQTNHFGLGSVFQLQENSLAAGVCLKQLV